MTTMQLAALRQLTLKLEIPALESEETIKRIIQQVQAGQLQLSQLHRKRIVSSSDDEYEPQPKKPLVVDELDQIPKKYLIANDELDKSGKKCISSSVEVPCIDQLTTRVIEPCNENVDKPSSEENLSVKLTRESTTPSTVVTSAASIKHFLNNYYERFTQADIQEKIQQISDCLFKIISLHQQFRQIPSNRTRRCELETSKRLIVINVIHSMQRVISVFPDKELSQVVTGITFLRVFEKFKMKSKNFKFKTGLFQNCTNLLLSCLKKGTFTNSSLITSHLTDKRFSHFCIMLLDEIEKMTAETGRNKTGATETTYDNSISDTGVSKTSAGDTTVTNGDQSDAMDASSTIDSNVVASETSDSVLVSEIISAKTVVSDSSKNDTIIVDSANVSKPVVMETLFNNSGNGEPIVTDTGVSKTIVPDTSNTDTVSKDTNQVGETVSPPCVDTQLTRETDTNQSVINEAEVCEPAAEVPNKSKDVCQTLIISDRVQEKTTTLTSESENRENSSGNSGPASAGNISSHVVSNSAVEVDVNESSHGLNDSTHGGTIASDTTARATIASDIIDHINQIEDDDVSIISEQRRHSVVPRIHAVPVEFPCVLCTDLGGSVKFHDMGRDICSTNLKAHLYLPLTRQFDTTLAYFPLHTTLFRSSELNLLPLGDPSISRDMILLKIFFVNLIRYYRAWMFHVADGDLKGELEHHFAFLASLSSELVEALPDRNEDLSKSQKELAKYLCNIMCRIKRSQFRYCTLKLYQVEIGSVRHKILTDISAEMVDEYLKQKKYDPFVANNNNVVKTLRERRHFRAIDQVPQVSLFRLITSVNMLLGFVNPGKLRQSILKEHDSRILSFLKKFDIQLQCDKLIEPIKSYEEKRRMEPLGLHLASELYTDDPYQAKNDRVNYAWYSSKSAAQVKPSSSVATKPKKLPGSMPQLISLLDGPATGTSNGLTLETHTLVDSTSSCQGNQATPVIGIPSNDSHKDMPSLESPQLISRPDPVASSLHGNTITTNNSEISNPSHQGNTNNPAINYQNNSSGTLGYQCDWGGGDSQGNPRAPVLRPTIPAENVPGPITAPLNYPPILPRGGSIVSVPNRMVQPSQRVPESTANGGLLLTAAQQAYAHPPPSYTAAVSSLQKIVVPSSRGRGVRGRGASVPRGMQGRGRRLARGRRGGGGIRLVDPSRLYESSAQKPPSPSWGYSDALSWGRPDGVVFSNSHCLPLADTGEMGGDLVSDRGSFLSGFEGNGIDGNLAGMDEACFTNIDESSFTPMGEMGKTYCALCGSCAEMQCSGCNKIFYCSDQCQLKHWNLSHSQQCGVWGR